MNPNVQILQGDSVVKLKEIESNSIELTVTSPPYDNLRTYGGFTWDFEATAKELFRVMVHGGIVCWNVGDSVVDGSETLTSFRQALFFKDQCGFNVHDTMIYEKTNFGHPEKSRYHQLFEYVFILSKGKPRVFNPMKDKPNLWAGTGTFGVSTMRQANGDQIPKRRNITAAFGMRGNVWRGKTAGQENVCTKIDHPAKMPDWLARDLIISWSKEGDTVLDPFAGGGTTASQSIALNRKSLNIELNADYVTLIRERVGLL